MHSVAEEIVDANIWRDGEFAKFKVNMNKVDETLWCRMCIPMIYAHWEGYVVSSLKIMLNYLNRLELQHAQVSTNMAVLSLGDSFKFLSGKQSFLQRVDFTNGFYEMLDKAVKFRTKVDTKSNLKSKVLKDLCDIFGFRFQKFSGVTNDLDRLIGIRNAIAHGENSINPDLENLNIYIEAVKRAMDLLFEEVVDFLTTKQYLSDSEN